MSVCYRLTIFSLAREGEALASREGASSSAERRPTMVIDERPVEDLSYEIAPEVQVALAKHPGKCAALTPTTILAIRDTSTEASDAAHEAGVESPILYLIPDSPSGYSYF
jgi:hypothetical protein